MLLFFLFLRNLFDNYLSVCPLFGESCAVFNLTGELSAGCVDIVSAHLSHGCDNAGAVQSIGKGLHRLRLTAFQSGPWERIERDQIKLARDILHQSNQFFSLRDGIVNAADQDVLERYKVSWRDL